MAPTRRKVRTTIDPGRELEVDQAEYARLKELGVLLPDGVPVRVGSTWVDRLGRLKAALPTHNIQTTIRPDLTITVTDDEYQQLLAQGLVYSGSPVAPVADFYDNIVASKVSGGTATPAALRAAFVSSHQLVLSPTAPTSPAAGTVWINTII